MRGRASGRTGGCVAKERLKPARRVLGAGCVARERLGTAGRVEVAGCVAGERLKTARRVVGAGCEFEEGIIALGGIVTRIASVRGWRDRSSRQ